MSIWQDIAARISAASGHPFEPGTPGGLGGGCINRAFRLTDGAQTWFVKTNAAERLDMFEAEAEGLNALADSGTIKVPRALCTGVSEGASYIVMQYLELGRGGASA